MRNLPQIRELVTHDGAFHPDEVLASAVLYDLFPGTDRIRSRNPAYTSPAPGRIVYDVGSVYDPGRGMFDHHQIGAPLRDCGTPYSSFGLIWKEYGKHWLARRVPKELVSEIHARLDSSLVRLVDGVDTGAVSPSAAGAFQETTLFQMIMDQRPNWKENSEQAELSGFYLAVSLAGTVLENRAAAISSDLEATAIVRRKVRETDGPVLTLAQNIPWYVAIFEPGAEHILAVVHPRAEDEWSVNMVPVEPGSYERRVNLPEEWAGLRGEELQNASGIASAVFCHTGRFVAFTKTAEDAVLMAEKALGIEGKVPGLGF